MRIGVWGIGSVGTGVACRLSTATFTSELVLVNRTAATARARAVDIVHGLAFAPTCRGARALAEETVGRHLAEVDLLVLTGGAGVPRGGTRNDAYVSNREYFRSRVIPQLREYAGIIVVVSNPVDLMTRLLVVEARLSSARVMGLGTVVETARFRAALASNALHSRPPHDVRGFVVGSHDEHCVPLLDASITAGMMCGQKEIEVARDEVVAGAARVKAGDIGTLHPIVEGVVAVVAAVARDAHRTLTVSVVDENDVDRLSYSVPCAIGRQGVIERHDGALADVNVAPNIVKAREKLREVLRSAGA